MITEKLEEKVLYDARGNIHSKLVCKIYEPVPILQKPEKEYIAIPLLQPGKTYEKYPIIKSSNYDRYSLNINSRDSAKTENYSTNKAA